MLNGSGTAILIWMAWSSSVTPANTDRSGLCDIWQYSSTGSVPGISGPVDLDVSYHDFAVPPYTCDTTTDVEIKLGGCYTAKTTGDIQLVPGTAGRVQIIYCPQKDYTLWHIVPIGQAGQDVGIYPAGSTNKLFTVKIK